MYSGIYTITNKLDGKIYVGYTKHLSQRKWEHMSRLAYNTHTSAHLQNAVNQYGIENFEYETLEEYPEKLLVAMEHYWCNMLDTHNPERGYNILPTNPEGENKRMSEYTKGKIRVARAKQIITEDHKRKISQSLKGRDTDNPNKTIEIFNMENDLIGTCSLVMEAAKITGVSRTSISNNLTGRSKHAGFLKFKYKEA